MCDIDYDGEQCDVWVNTWHHARKPKPCHACSSTIEPGGRYMRHFHVFDGSTTTEFLCGACGDAVEAFSDAHHGLPESPAGISRMLRECIDNGDDGSKERWVPVLAALDARHEASRARR